MWPFNGDELKKIRNRLNDFGKQLASLSRWDYNFVYSKCAKIDPLQAGQSVLFEKMLAVEKWITEQEEAKKMVHNWINHCKSIPPPIPMEESKPKPKPKPKPKAKHKRTRKQGK